MKTGVYYTAGIDSGSTSTDVVILDQDGKIKSTRSLSKEVRQRYEGLYSGVFYQRFVEQL